jgi:hypothetical protein
MSVTEAAVKFTAGKLTQAEYVAYLRSQKLTREQILGMVANKSLPVAVGLAMLEEADKLKGSVGLYPKVSEKGGVSIYGLSRWPVTLYKEQWERLLSDEFLPVLKQFLKDNDAILKTKPAKE